MHLEECMMGKKNDVQGKHINEHKGFDRLKKCNVLPKNALWKTWSILRKVRIPHITKGNSIRVFTN